MLRSAVPATPSSSSSTAPVASSWQERIAGGRITTAAPAFSKDGDFLITCAASLLKVYSVKTGEVVKALRHKSVITGFFFNPANALQLYSATEEGIIRLWDFEDGVLLKSWKIGGEGKIAQAVLDATHSVAYLRVIKTSGKKTHYISTFNLCNHTSRVRYTSAEPLSDLYVSPQGDFFAVLFPNRLGFYLFDVNSLTRHSVEHRFKITAFDFHPTDRCVAYGDKTGLVHINYCLPHTDNNNVEMSEASEKSAPSTNSKRESQKKHEQQQIVKLQWHATPISALHFSPDGFYLFTGAQEEVLVLWRLHSNEKIFVPRLGAGIASVTLNEQATVYAVCCMDNSIRLIDALSRNLLMAIQGISLELGRMPIAIEPRNSLIVTSFKNGFLQHYDPVRDKHVEELEVVSNPQVFFNEREQVPMARVTRVAYGPKGSYMITVDERPQSDVNEELRLKFWTHDGKQYVLNTEADKPHSTSITGLACHPILPLVATCSKDGKFKLWEQRAKPPMPGAKDQTSKLMWACRSVGDYKGLPASAISFSTDGSLLAVAYESTITLWDPMATTFHRSLTFTNCNAEKITHVAFAPSSRYLISATKTQLFVWDLLRCAVVWSYLIEVKDLVVDSAVNFKANLVFPSPSSLVSCFAVTDGNFIFLFNPASSRPLHVWKVEKHKAITLAFEATSSLLPEGRVVYLNDKSELVYLEKKLEKKPEKTDQEKVTLSMTKVNMRKEPPKEEKLSGFEHAFGKLSLSQPGSQVRAEDVGILVPREDAGTLYNPSAPQLSRLFNGPSHLLPSPAKICSSFMEGLLKKAHTYVAPVTASSPEAAQQPEDASNEGGDSAMQVDVAVPPDTQTQQTSGVLANGALDDAQTSKNLKKQSKATEKVFYDSMFKFFSSYAARDEEAEMPASLLDELTATVAQPKKPNTPKKNAGDKEKAVATTTTTSTTTTTTTTTTTVTPTKSRRQKKRASQTGTGADQVEDAMAVDGGDGSSGGGKEGQANGTAKSSKTTPRRRRKSAQQQQD